MLQPLTCCESQVVTDSHVGETVIMWLVRCNVLMFQCSNGLMDMRGILDEAPVTIDLFCVSAINIGIHFGGIDSR